MTQAAPTIGANESGTQYRTDDNNGKSALNTTHKGASRPSYAAAGTIWCNDSANPIWSFYMYDGTDDILWGTFNTSTNVFTPGNAQTQSGAETYAADTGAAGAITINLSPAITSYTAGLAVRVKLNNTVNGATTIAINGLAAKTVNKNYNVAIVSGDYVAGQILTMVYDGTNFQVVNASLITPLVLPTGYRDGAQPVWVNTTTFSVANINNRDSADTTNIIKTSSTTVDVTTTGLNGIAQSANLTGTVSVTSGSATVTFSSSQAGVLQAGDVITTAGGQSRRLISGSGTSWTAESTFGSTETTVTVKRGGRAKNTFYNLYAMTNGTTPGLILSTRNMAGGDTLVDLPSGYNNYRQLSFFILLDPSTNIFPFWVGPGWPIKPYIDYMVGMPGGSMALANVTSTTYVNVDATGVVPPIASCARIYFGNSLGSTFVSTVRTSSTIGNDTTIFSSPSTGEKLQEFFDLPLSARTYDAKTSAGTFTADVKGVFVDQVN